MNECMDSNMRRVGAGINGHGQYPDSSDICLCTDDDVT